jgi:hypothetical protein
VYRRFSIFLLLKREQGTETHSCKIGWGEAKFWLDDVELVWNHGFNERQMQEIEAYIRAHQSALIDSWVEFFGEEGNG